MSPVVKCAARVYIWLFQLYGDLQPVNAEPLSSEALIGALSASLPQADIRLSLLTMEQWQAEQDEILAQIEKTSPDLIGFSCPQGTYDLSMRVLETLYARVAHPPPVVLGHALPTYLPQMFLERFPDVLIVRGWGEPAIVELARQLATKDVHLERIPSLTYLNEHKLRQDNPIQWVEQQSSPTRLAPHRYFARIEASRGCHYNICTFCSRPPLAQGQPTWRRFDRASVLAQVEQLVSAGVKTFTFTDEDFLGNDPQGALDLAEGLCAFHGLDFALSVRADNVVNPHGTVEENALRRQVFQTLKNAGLTLVFIGAESFSPSQLRRYGKGNHPDNTIDAIHFLETLGIELELGLILFDPLVTLEELDENIHSLQQSHFWRYAGQMFSFLRPQVGTAYVRLLEKRGMLGELHPNTMEYDASYASAAVMSLASACRLWNTRFNRFYLALRNVSRSDLGGGRFSAFLEQYRSIQFEFLGHLICQARQHPRDGICPADMERWHRLVWLLMDELVRFARHMGELSVSEQALLQAARNERENRPSSEIDPLPRIC